MRGAARAAARARMERRRGLGIEGHSKKKRDILLECRRGCKSGRDSSRRVSYGWRPDDSGVAGKCRYRRKRLFRQFARAMAVAPAAKVGHVEADHLDGQDIAGVVNILAAPAGFGPAELDDDDLLRARDEGFDSLVAGGDSLGKSDLIVGIIVDFREFKHKGHGNEIAAESVARSGGDGLNGDLGFQSEFPGQTIH